MATPSATLTITKRLEHPAIAIASGLEMGAEHREAIASGQGSIRWKLREDIAIELAQIGAEVDSDAEEDLVVRLRLRKVAVADATLTEHVFGEHVGLILRAHVMANQIFARAARLASEAFA